MSEMHEHSEVDLSSIPRWIFPPFFVCEERLKEEAKFLHLTMRGLGQLERLPGLLEALQDLEEADAAKRAARAESRLEAARSDAKWVANEAANDFPILHSHSVVGVWTALEVLCQDFALAWLRNAPNVWTLPEVAKLKLPIGAYQSLPEQERARFVVSELERALGADLRKGVGKLKSLLGVFGLAPTVGPNIRQALHELCQLRNVMVHCAGFADDKFVAECPTYGATIGERVIVPHALYGWYYHAARRYAERVSNQAFLALGMSGCSCPGMDDVEARPTC